MLGSSHSTYAPLATSAMAYMLNNQMVNTMLNGGKSNGHVAGSYSSMNIQEELLRLQEQNQSLLRKVQSKSAEVEKYATRAEKMDRELQSYKKLVEQIRHALSMGEISPALQFTIQRVTASIAKKYPTSKKTKFSAGNCHCCTGEAEKPFLCEWANCGKRFRTKQHLEAHGNVHTGRRFNCEWPGCTKSFCRKFSLVEHAKMHSESNPNTCTYCNITFSSKYGLLRHQNAQHAMHAMC